MKRRFSLIRPTRAHAFSLVELLTVIFIIGLLIAILIPSLSAARNSAKKAVTLKTMSVVESALEMFRNDNGSDFPQSNGYPPSFSHPPIPNNATPHDPTKGQIPYLNGNPGIYGAQWLPAMLMGIDQLGFIKRSSVTAQNDLNKQPAKWYTPDALGTGPITDRAPKYLDAENLPLKKTKDLPGKRNQTLFPDWDKGNDPGIKMNELWVIVDGFDQPILYYAATAHGQMTNMVEDKHLATGNYAGSKQATGTPFYFHQDNEGFTGNDTTAGWDFSGNGKPHPIAEVGATQTPKDFGTANGHMTTFAHYVVDRKMLSTFNDKTPDTAPMRPVNAESYLLISAGVDGKYGTADDPSNLPPFLAP
ncbi:MAG: prepilin-type N-terminal cleavage/methylation domain-containing protein [Planctomycetes bacterium]|nr:prepilin-type N-terminal cleavage/methylation domain-containing protein [Planctomycetota bacterium]MBI3832780.1 prepilin-type N-terminal cleavage/methylation domain-containing protein [Planctomycetota bacterium]